MEEPLGELIHARVPPRDSDHWVRGGAQKSCTFTSSLSDAGMQLSLGATVLEQSLRPAARKFDSIGL